MRITDLPLLMEVKEEYLALRRFGKSRNEATEQIIEAYADETLIGAEDDGLQFWIGLADGQYTNNELTLEVAEQAYEALNNLAKSGRDITLGDIERRRKNYSKAPMPERRIGKPRPKFRCSWQIGDTFAYQLSGPHADALGISGKYVLLRKVSEVETSDGNVFPVVSLSLWENEKLPKSREEFLSVPFLRLERGRFGLPHNYFEYRAEIIIKNRKQLALMPFVYLGNFQEVPMPEDEVILERSGDIVMTELNTFDQDVCIRVKLSRYYYQETQDK